MDIEKFETLIKPIRDLAQNWNIDVAHELEDYLSELDGIEINLGSKKKLNFSQAALMIQGSTNVYSKKVEYLYRLVNTILDHILKQKRIPKEKTNGIRNRKKSEEDLFDSFELLDDQLEDVDENLINLKEENVMNAINFEKKKTKDLSALYSVYAPRNLSYKNMAISEITNYKLMNCEVDNSGALLLDRTDVELLGLIKKQDNLRFLYENSNRKSITQKPADFSKFDFEDDGDDIMDEGNEQRDVSKALNFNENENEEEKNQSQQEKDLENQIAEDFKIDEDGDDIMSDDEEENEEDDEYHLNEQKIWEKWEPLDPHEKTNALGEDKPFEKKTKFKIPKVPIEKEDYPLFGISVHRNNILNVLPYKDKVNYTKLHHKEFEYFLKYEKMRIRSINASRRKELQLDNEVDDNGIIEDDDILEDSGDFLGDDSNVVADEINVHRSDEIIEGNNQDSSEIVHSKDTDIFFDIPDEDGDDLEEDLINGERFSFSKIRYSIGKFIGEEEKLKQVTKTYEDLCKEHILKFLRNTDKFLQEDSLVKKVDDWKKKIEPILKKMEDLEPFDIPTYTNKVLQSFEHINEKKRISEIYKGGLSTELCRIFLAILVLANSGNCKIDNSEENLSVTLLKFEKFDIEEFLAPSLQ